MERSSILSWIVLLLSVVSAKHPEPIPTSYGIAGSSPYAPQLREFWHSGHEYVYEYEGRLMSGIPELNKRHMAGMAIRCRVHLQILNSTYRAIAVKDVEQVSINEELPPTSGQPRDDNWRLLPLPSYKPVSEGWSKVLAYPAIVKLYTAEYSAAKEDYPTTLESMVFYAEEPEWSVNFKKSLVAQLLEYSRARPGSTSQLVETASIYSGVAKAKASHADTRSKQQIEDIYSEERPLHVKKYEESVDGICETTYDAYQVPPVMAQEKFTKQYHSACRKMAEKPGQSPEMIEVVKVRNTEKCYKSTEQNHMAPGHLKHNYDGSSSLKSRSSISRYTVCRGHHGDWVVDSVHNENELSLNLMAIKTEKMVSGVKQKMSLLSKSVIGNPMKVPEHNKVVKSLRIVYESLPAARNSVKIMSASPYAKYSKEEMYEKIEHEFHELIRSDMAELKNYAGKQAPLKALEISNGMRAMSYDEVKYVLKKLDVKYKDSMIYMNIVNDIFNMCGTSPCTEVLLDRISEGKVKSLTSQISVVANIPRVVRNPSSHLLMKLYKSMVSAPVFSSKIVRNQALLSYCQLVYKACMSKLKKEYYPPGVGSSKCSAHSEVVVDKLVPHIYELISEGSKSQRSMAIIAAGILGHEKLLPALLKVIESAPYYADKSSYVRVARVLAVQSMTRIGRYRAPVEVHRILDSIIANRAESYEVRSAAFNVLLKTSPSMSSMQKVVMLSWSEHDEEFLKVVNTAMYTISKQSIMQDVSPEHVAMIRRAQLIYPLLKKTQLLLPSSASYWTNEFLDILGIDCSSRISYTASRHSSVPEQLEYQLSYVLDKYELEPLSLKFNMHGTDGIVQNFISLYNDYISLQGEPDWEKIKRTLNMKLRRSEEPLAMISIKIFQDTIMAVELNSETLKELAEEAISAVTKMQGTHPVSSQAIYDIGPNSLIIPTDMGLPFWIELHNPLLVLSKGKTSIHMDLMTPSVSYEGQIIVQSQLYGFVGTVNEFTNRKLIVGLDNHISVEVPTKMSMHLDMHTQELKLKSKLLPSSGIIDLVHIHSRPFSTDHDASDLNPITFTNNFTLIESETKSIVSNYAPFPGFTLNTTVQTPLSAKHILFQKMKMFGYNPFNVFRFALANVGMDAVGQLSLRNQKFVLRYIHDEAKVDELDLTIQLHSASKLADHPWVANRVGIASKHQAEATNEIPYKIEATGGLAAKTTPKYLRAVTAVLADIKQIMEEVERCEAVAFAFKLHLSGPHQRKYKYEYQLGVGVAEKGLDRKLAIMGSELYNGKSDYEKPAVCVTCSLQLPVMPPAWNWDLIRAAAYKIGLDAKLEYGPSCRGSKVEVKVQSMTSPSQKSKSRSTVRAIMLDKLIAKKTPLIQSSYLSEEIRKKSSLLDEYDIDVKVEHSKVTSTAAIMAVDFLKVYWLPNIKYMMSALEPIMYAPYSHPSNIEMKIKVKIDETKKRANVAIHMPGSKSPVVFENIALPSMWPYLYTAGEMSGKSLPEIAYRSMTRQSSSPTCKMEHKSIQTYDNVTLDATIDKCYHLLSADCSPTQTYAVLVRKPSPGLKQLRVLLPGGVQIDLPPKQPGGPADAASISIRNTLIPLSKYRKTSIKNHKGYEVATAVKTDDGVVIIDSRYVRVKFDGTNRSEIESSVWMKGKLCGICGDYNNLHVADKKSPRECALSSSLMLTSSYRLPDYRESCPVQEHEVTKALTMEEEKCVRDVIIPADYIGTMIPSGYHRTPSSRSDKYEAAAYGEEIRERPTMPCVAYKHDVIYRAGRTCLSKQPIAMCKPGCKADGPLRVKEIPYTCLDGDQEAYPGGSRVPRKSLSARSSAYVVEKVKEGRLMPELMKASTDITEVHRIPRACKYNKY